MSKAPRKRNAIRRWWKSCGFDLPQRVRGELKQASYVKTTQKLPLTSKVTLEVHCDEVPGGVVAHWASETDSAGRVLRRSTLELLDYGLPSPPGQPQPVSAGPCARERPLAGWTRGRRV